MSTSQDSGHHAPCAMQSLHSTRYLPAERTDCCFLLSAKAFCSASACQGNPTNTFVTLDDSYKAISVIAYRIDLIFIACQHRQNNNSTCLEKKYGVEYITIKFKQRRGWPCFTMFLLPLYYKKIQTYAIMYINPPFFLLAILI